MDRKKVIIFGTAKRGSEVLAILSQLPQYEAAAFSCNDEALWGMEKEGLGIIAPADMRRLHPGAAVVIASASYMEIETQLTDGQLLPDAGCLRMERLIGELSDEEKAALSARVQRETCFYNLDYKEVRVPPEPDTGEKYLVICTGGYPSAASPRCMFAHERVLQYQRAGLKVEAFGLIEGAPFEEYEYQGVRVFQGGVLELEEFLGGRNYRKYLVHFVCPDILYAVGRAGKTDVPMIVWCHGYEILPWYCYWINYSDEEVQENGPKWQRMDREKQRFLQDCFQKETFQLVFVSNWLKERVNKFVGRLPKNYAVIPNCIDAGFYKPEKREPSDRLRILSVKSHGSRKYANDLTAKAILALSEKPFFQELTFDLYGDGCLFEENFATLMKEDFPNVHIHQKMLERYEMKKLFAENGVFLSPTRLDAQGVTANEAMAAGMAVISCNTSAIKEFMDESCASLFEYDNYWMMAEEIEYLYNHPDEFLEKAKNARERVVRQCGYDHTIRQELRLILDEA